MAEKKKRGFSLESGKQENKNYRRCQQTQCAYYINGGCKSCEECNAKPFLLDKECSRCHDCENVPDALRWTDKKKKKSSVKVSEEDIHKALVAIAAQIVANKATEELRKEPDVEIIVGRQTK